MFNSRPSIRYVPITAGQVCVVVDDFLADPAAMVRHAAEHRSSFANDAANSYPGIELDLPRDWAFALDEFFMLHVRKALGARRTISVSARLSLATLTPDQLSPLQRLCHRDFTALPQDQGVAASVAYLFDQPQMGGTSFYLPTRPLDDTARMLKDAARGELGADMSRPGYLTASNAWFEQVASVPAAFNRAIFYDGAVFHAAQITAPGLLSSDPATGRLTMNGFFRHRRSATPP